MRSASHRAALSRSCLASDRAQRAAANAANVVAALRASGRGDLVAVKDIDGRPRARINDAEFARAVERLCDTAEPLTAARWLRRHPEVLARMLST
jgi:hypothetical protein